VDCRYTWEKSHREPKPISAPKSRIYLATCKMCAAMFVGRSAQAKMCSEECRRLRQIRTASARIKDLYYGPAFDPVTRAYPGKPRQDALIAYLVDRDGDKCGICRRKVDITLKSGTKGSRKGPSIDHIVPRSKGGTDDPANLRLTHWGCNQARGNRGGAEQLALVG